MAAHGNCLFDFLHNMNSMHYHLQGSLPSLVPPEFAVEAGGDKRTLILHYWSMRPGLAPLVEGVVQQVAKDYFHLTLNFDDYEMEEIEVDNVTRHYARFVIRSEGVLNLEPGQSFAMQSQDAEFS
eukprot:TRINITY_DN15312_c0_g1_i1.p1 TRINITY_DN15312_c0_g1~~TRINITY_DN15312_c0_g1_i1.p1  ORF type:complete len:125 (-),score=19.52 TRINITY_DN15312_c0_g1_i1:405-779(-)